AGPIVVRAFDPVSKRFGEPLLRSQTEAIYIFRWIADRLYAPHIDPAGDATAGGFAVGEINAGGRHVWTDRSAVTAVHLFDINSMGSSDLWLAGADGPDAVLWRSVDRGATWNESLRQPPRATSPARFYGIGVLAGHLYVQANEPGGSTCKVFDGDTWRDGPSLLPPGGIF